MPIPTKNANLSRRNFFLFAGSAAAALSGLGLVGCSGSGAASNGGSTSSADSSSSKKVSGSVTAVGSTALQPLVEAAAEKFMETNPDVQITVQGGGSGQGITQISQGAVQIGNSDVFAESKLSNPDDAKKLVDNKVAIVGMGPVAHPEVSIDDLTLDQLKGIFTGAITNWKEVGGQDLAITVINRASGSGTRATFEGAVLGGTKVPESFKPQEQDSSGTVAKMVAETPGSISYLAFSYFSDKLKALKVGGVEPKEETVETNDWTIWAYEHMYTSTSPDEATQAFIDYMLSDDVQGSLVEQTGYIPVTGMKVTRDASGNVTKK
ncbi:phosphate ABC transporter substrate-binding protein [Olsenella sp. HMSC062G07]|uniref:phosphate ABC transporter substrate-binding protein n=1 Tax=Olsenella sp. HMSC062G07 TaxID=1739330 RepID=UPI000A5B096C|nr:phosphate ABC transporter substrate-binding protein [Olsenella sp. HMSC062G07]